MRVAMVQLCPPPGYAEMLVEVECCVRAAACGGADIVVFPELYCPGFHAVINREPHQTALPKAFTRRAQPIPGPLTRVVGQMARRAGGIYVVFTLLERDVTGSTYSNAAVLLSGDGELIHTHRKTMLTPRIDDGITPGAQYDVVDTRIGRIAMLICADATCPEPARILALKGAEVVFVCSGDFRSSWTIGKRDFVEQIWLNCSASPSRAIDNALFWIAVNGSGVQGGVEFFGGSRAIAPDGDIVVQGAFGSNAQAILFADLDLDVITCVNSTFPLMARRRPELYGLLVANPSSPDPEGDQ